MAKKITIEMLLAAKQKHLFSWHWTPLKELPPSRFRSFSSLKTKRKLEFQVKCGGCNKEHWVLWNELNKGRTKACRTCAKAPTQEEMFELVEKNQTYYTPTIQWKMVKGRRYVLMNCKCGKRNWVSWNQYQQGSIKGCKSCRSFLRKHGHGKDPIWVSWKDMKRRNRKKNNIIRSWWFFPSFEEWAKPLYSPGWKLVRIDKTLPYGPDNCDYVPINKKDIIIPTSNMLPISDLQKSNNTQILPIGSK